jgi:hypothetical protein
MKNKKKFFMKNKQTEQDENVNLVIKNENAYANGKKMTCEEFFALSEMILGSRDMPDDLE